MVRWKNFDGTWKKNHIRDDMLQYQREIEERSCEMISFEIIRSQEGEVELLHKMDHDQIWLDTHVSKFVLEELLILPVLRINRLD